MSAFHTLQTIHFTSVTLKVRSLETSLNFYQGILGMTVDRGDLSAALSTDGKTPLIYLEEDKNAVAGTRHLGLYHFALLLPSRKALAQIFLRLTEREYPLAGASDHGVSEALYLHDPDGNGIEIYRDRDESEWPKKDGAIDMVSLPLNIADVMCVIGDSGSAGLPPETRIGHLHFHVASLKEARQFYSDVLGFELKLDYGGSALFMADGGYHHHVGLNIWMPSRRPRRDNEVGLISYGLVVPDKKALTEKLRRFRIAYEEKEGVIAFKDILNQTIMVR